MGGANTPDRLLIFDASYAGNVNLFKAALNSHYISGNPVIVEYRQNTPTPPERVQLGTLASFPRYTHVEQIDNGLPIRMELDSRVIDQKEI